MKHVAGIAQSIGAKETEIIFTSGGTEADNYAIFGVAEANSETRESILLQPLLNIMLFCSLSGIGKTRI